MIRSLASSFLRVFAFSLLLPFLALAARAEAPRKPNIVLILADDLGWTDLACTGSRFYETPHLDRLRAQGMQFTAAYANGPNCAPTRASLMSGKYTPRHGITNVGAGLRGPNKPRRLQERPSKTVLPLEERTVAEALKAAGYRTAHVGKWHLGSGPTGPEGQGFDLNIGGDRSGHPTNYHAPYRREIPGLGAGREGEYLTDRLTEEAVRFIEESRDRPFFLYLPHFAVHTPIQAKEAVTRKYAAKAKAGGHGNAEYAAMIESLDEGVGRVMETLERLKLAGNTLVIFTSDNGGWAGATSNAPLRGYKGMLYEGGIRVPMLARWPGKTRPGATCETPVVSLDLCPTLLEAAGVRPSSEQTLDGESLLPLLSGGGGSLKRDTVYWHFPHYLEAGPNVPGPWRTTPASALRSGDWKLIEFFEDGRLELYNLRDDLGEGRNLAAEMPEKTRELHGSLKAWRERVGAYVPPPL